MKNIAKSWVFAFSVTVLLLLLIVFATLFKSETTAPTKGWSRGIRIANIDKSDDIEFDKVRVTSLPIVKDNTFVTLWEIGDSLNYRIISNSGSILEEGKFNYKFPPFEDISSLMHNGSIEVFDLSNKKLNKYVLDFKNRLVSSSELIDSNTMNFIIKNDMIVYSTDKAIKLIDNQGVVHTIDNVPSAYLDVAKDGDIFYINYVVEKPLISASFNYATYDYSKKVLELYKGATMVIPHNTSLVNSVLGVNNKNVTNLAVFRDWESGDTLTSNITFQLGKKASLKINQLDMRGSNPNPMMLNSGNDYMEFIASVDHQISYRTIYQNLALVEVRHNNIINERFLTKTNGISKEPKVFTLGKDTYLQWEDVSSSSKSIYFASTNATVIKKAKNLRTDEIVDIFMSTLLGVAFGASFILLLIAVVVFPALLIIVMISMFALTWVENNTAKMLNICIGLQFITKVLITNRFSSMLIKIKPSLPSFLQYTPGLFLVVVLTTIIATYCVKRKYSKVASGSSIFVQYIFFALTDLVLYSLIFFPYYYLK